MIPTGKIIIAANSDWYLYNFRLSLAKALRRCGWQVVLASPNGPYVSRLLEEGLVWREIPLSRSGMRPHEELHTLISLLRLYREESPILVHHHTMKLIVYGTLAARAARVPLLINSVSGLGYLFSSERLSLGALREVIKRIYRIASARDGIHLIFEHEGDRDYFLQSGLVRAEHTSLIPGVGVDLTRYSPSPEPNGRPLVILASRMLWDKGVGEFVEAARQLIDKGVSARFALVGDPDPGNPSSIPPTQLQLWANQGIVEWWGHRTDMASVFRNCHVVTLPSKSEGVPTVLLEAAASGRPIVASNIPGCREAVLDRISGLLIPVADSGALSNAIESLLLVPETRRKMGNNGRIWVEDRFDQDVLNDRIVSVYETLLA